MPDKKSNKEIIQELVDIIADTVSGETGANTIMLRPALNVVKLKMAQLDENESANIVDKVHFISHYIEKETGILSPYHAID